jgi:glycerol uptake facilitator-like aquaporin
MAGCVAGAVVANAMFGLSAASISTTHRASPPHLFAEVIATVGLLLVIFSLARTHRGQLAPAAVGAYIGAAYFFTSSTSFANPAIDTGRVFSDTFAGIAPASVPAFIGVQVLGGAVALGLIAVLYPDITSEEARRDLGAAGGLATRSLTAVAFDRRPCPNLVRPLSTSSSRSFVARSAEESCHAPTPASAAATATALTSPARGTPA